MGTHINYWTDPKKRRKESAESGRATGSAAERLSAWVVWLWLWSAQLAADSSREREREGVTDGEMTRVTSEERGSAWVCNERVVRYLRARGEVLGAQRLPAASCRGALAPATRANRCKRAARRGGGRPPRAIGCRRHPGGPLLHFEKYAAPLLSAFCDFDQCNPVFAFIVSMKFVNCWRWPQRPIAYT